MTSEEKDREIIRLIAEVRTLQVENKKLAGEYVGLVLAAKELQAKASSGYAKAAVQRKEGTRLLAANVRLIATNKALTARVSTLEGRL